MGKGIFFTLLFGALFLLLFSLIAFYSLNLGERGSQQSKNLQLGKFAYIGDDISSDLLSFLRIRGLSISRNSSHAFISVNETFPSPYNSPQTELSQYKTFIEGRYARRQNMNGRLLLDLSAFQNAPFIYFSNADLNYSYASLDKDSAAFRGSPSIKKYSLLLQALAPAEFRECGWESLHPGGLEVEIAIPSSNCALQIAYLDPLQESKFWANTSSGKYLNISFGLVGGNPYAYGLMDYDGITLLSELNATFASVQPIDAWLPAGLEFVDEYAVNSLVARSG